ncbi:branched-chain amino acid transport system ATP-binding protein [Paraburkholderia sp. BL8N3]|jgi:branched-chain amino acid transport system ATP-binding protein|nr:ABC transporter ATP-binding protein [Paraburkholderia sp. BL8N3]TCK39383.1 branched-chain amino acid transport system ATP-binding protein [Paraburkholderia sp. BL8N3]
MPAVAENARQVEASRTRQAPVLETRGLRREFAGFVAVAGVDLRFEGTGVFGIIGPNGAGKTTFFNLLSSFLKPSAGTVHYDDTEISRLNPQRVSRLGIVRSFQITSIFGHMSVAENLLLPMQRRASSGCEFWRRSRGLDEHRQEIQDIMDEVGIARTWRDEQASALPYGLKRSLELGISLASRPRVLLLDEPTAGMSSQDIGRIIDLIREIARERMVIMVEHNLRVVSDLARQIIVLQQGSVLTVGTYDEVHSDPRVIEAYLGGKRSHGHA